MRLVNLTPFDGSSGSSRLWVRAYPPVVKPKIAHDATTPAKRAISPILARLKRRKSLHQLFPVCSGKTRVLSNVFARVDLVATSAEVLRRVARVFRKESSGQVPLREHAIR